jgi:hypothetical protein
MSRSALLTGFALRALVAAAAAVVGAPALAITVTENIGQNQLYPSGNGFNVTTQVVNLPADFTGASISIQSV